MEYEKAPLLVLQVQGALLSDRRGN
jgi:hypothetical protein